MTGVWDVPARAGACAVGRRRRRRLTGLTRTPQLTAYEGHLLRCLSDAVAAERPEVEDLEHALAAVDKVGCAQGADSATTRVLADARQMLAKAEAMRKRLHDALADREELDAGAADEMALRVRVQRYTAALQEQAAALQHCAMECVPAPPPPPAPPARTRGLDVNRASPLPCLVCGRPRRFMDHLPEALRLQRDHEHLQAELARLEEQLEAANNALAMQAVSRFAITAGSSGTTLAVENAAKTPQRLLLPPSTAAGSAATPPASVSARVVELDDACFDADADADTFVDLGPAAALQPGARDVDQLVDSLRAQGVDDHMALMVREMCVRVALPAFHGGVSRTAWRAVCHHACAVGATCAAASST